MLRTDLFRSMSPNIPSVVSRKTSNSVVTSVNNSCSIKCVAVYPYLLNRIDRLVIQFYANIAPAIAVQVWWNFCSCQNVCLFHDPSLAILFCSLRIVCFLLHLTSIRSLPPALSLITFDLKHLFCFTNQAGTAFEIRLLLTTLNCSFRNYVSPSQQAVIACVWGTPLHPFKQTNRTLVCLCVFSHNHIFIGQYL